MPFSTNFLSSEALATSVVIVWSTECATSGKLPYHVHTTQTVNKSSMLSYHAHTTQRVRNVQKANITCTYNPKGTKRRSGSNTSCAMKRQKTVYNESSDRLVFLRPWRQVVCVPKYEIEYSTRSRSSEYILLLLNSLRSSKTTIRFILPPPLSFHTR